MMTKKPRMMIDLCEATMQTVECNLIIILIIMVLVKEILIIMEEVVTLRAAVMNQ